MTAPSDIESRAERFAMERHAGLTRACGEKAVSHLRRVAGLVRQYGGTPEIVAAAWLHDVIEDTGTTCVEVREVFGADVARIVVELTDPPEHLGLGHEWRRNRLVALASVMSASGAVVKACDILDNASTMPTAKPGYAAKWARHCVRLLDAIAPDVMCDAAVLAARRACIGIVEVTP